MRLYVYADESENFDQAQNDLFVYGGLVVPGDTAKTDIEHQYSAVESSIRQESGKADELKASYLSMRQRKRLYNVVERSSCTQFGFVVNQQKLRGSVFSSKGRKQRYLDWALKMGVKYGILKAMRDGTAPRDEIEGIVVFVDEHSSTTEGIYNLRESINEELRAGMYDSSGRFHEPVFSTDLPKIPVRYLDSKTVTLIRAADVTANWIFRAERDRDSYPQAMTRIERSAAIHRHP